jgi:hypothetical protein
MVKSSMPVVALRPVGSESELIVSGVVELALKCWV